MLRPKRVNTYDAYGVRYDGRRFDQIRNINYKFGLYPHADGSVYYEQGETKVICAVYGPRHSNLRASDDQCFINCQFSMASFSSKSKKRAQRSQEASKILERTIKNVVDRASYPKTRVDVFCEVLQGDGSHIATCINAISLALMDAGIPVKGIVSAVECGVVHGHVCTDLNYVESRSNAPRVIAACLNGERKTVMLDYKNGYHVSQLEKMLESAFDANAKVYSCLQAAIVDRTKDLQRTIAVDAL